MQMKLRLFLMPAPTLLFSAMVVKKIRSYSQMHAVLGINSEAINRIEFYSEQICSSLSPIFCLFPLPPSPRREGGNPQYINDLSPSLLGEGFRERQLSERYRGSTEKHRE
jgi:hypothetical protein